MERNKVTKLALVALTVLSAGVATMGGTYTSEALSVLRALITVMGG